MRTVCLHMIFYYLHYLPHNLITYKLIGTLYREGSPYLACNDRNAFFFLRKNLKNIMHGLVKMYVMR